MKLKSEAIHWILGFQSIFEFVPLVLVRPTSSPGSYDRISFFIAEIFLQNITENGK